MSHTKKTLLPIFLCLVLFLLSFSNQTISAKGTDSISFVILSKYSTTVDIGNEFYITAFTSNGKLPSWKSNNSKVASVNTYGKVTAKKSGTVTITAKIKNAEASCRVTVNKTRITISLTESSIEHGQTLRLSAATSNNSKITWKSSKKSIASVDENGTVIGIKPGETVITANADGSSVSCKINVKLPVINLDKEKISLFRGQKAQLSAAVSSGIRPVWKSNKKSVAVIDEYGSVTAIKHGTAVITATVDGVSKSCEVIVEQPTIVLNVSEINLKKGSAVVIKATVSSGISPVWSSSNTNVAAVDSSGKVTALKKGTAYIYAAEDGSKAKCIVHVTE